MTLPKFSSICTNNVVLCTGAGVPEPEPEFWPILPEMSRSQSLFNSGKTPAVHTLCCKFLRTLAKKSKSIDEKVLKYSHATDTVCLPQTCKYSILCMTVVYNT